MADVAALLREYSDPCILSAADEIDHLYAELAEAKARIAALEAAGNRLGDAAVDSVLTSIEAVTELAEAKARIAEQDRDIAAKARNLTHLNARAERAEARVAHEEAQTKIVLDSYALENQQLHDRAEQAEAALAIVQSKGGLKEKVALLASENGCLRAERSQTKRDLKDWQDSSEAYRADCKRAEAELKAMREAIRKIRATENITAVWHIADGALNPPPPD